MLKLIKKSQSGFSLIELLVAISLISILVAIGAMAYSQTQSKARDAQRKTDIEKMRAALEEYYADNREYPPDAVLGVCLTGSATCTLSSGKTTGNKVYLSSLPKDPRTGNNYRYLASDDNLSFSGLNYQTYVIEAYEFENGNFSDYIVKSPSN